MTNYAVTWKTTTLRSFGPGYPNRWGASAATNTLIFGNATKGLWAYNTADTDNLPVDPQHVISRDTITETKAFRFDAEHVIARDTITETKSFRFAPEHVIARDTITETKALRFAPEHVISKDGITEAKAFRFDVARFYSNFVITETKSFIFVESHIALGNTVLTSEGLTDIALLDANGYRYQFVSETGDAVNRTNASWAAGSDGGGSWTSGVTAPSSGWVMV